VLRWSYRHIALLWAKDGFMRLVSPKIEMLDVAALEHFDLGRLMPPEGHWMIRQELPD